MGFGKSSGSQTATLTPEQKEALSLQVGALKNTFLPAYENTVGGANAVLRNSQPYVNQAATNTYNNAASVSNAQQGIGGGLANAGGALTTVGGAGANAAAQGLTNAANLYGNQGGSGVGGVANYLTGGGQQMLGAGAQGLASLFSPNYKQEQIQAALQPAREAAREAQAGQNAMYGAAGGLGSSRMALADRNLASLNQQRMQSAAAQTSAAVESQRQAAANTLMGTGSQNLSTAGNLYSNLFTGGLGAGTAAGNLYGGLLNTGVGASTAGGGMMGSSVDTSGKAISAAQSPMDLYSRYASVVYGTPQASTTPNFSGTQGSSGNSKGFGGSFGGAKSLFGG
jgi:hypothetical protein